MNDPVGDAAPAVLEIPTSLASLQDFLERRLTARQQELLRRAALPASFDVEIIERVLMAGLPKPIDASDAADARWLLTHDDVVSAPNGTWRMRDSARTSRLSYWFGQGHITLDDGLPERTQRAIALSRDLYRLLSTRGAEWEMEALSQGFVGSAMPARRRFVALFDAADRANDVSRCYLLLRTVEERLPHVRACILVASGQLTAGPFVAVERAADQCRARYETRLAFLPDLERTSQVLERRVMNEEWKQLTAVKPARRGKKGKRASAPVTADRAWIVDLEAKGGSGKTMYLRWLGSHRCLPEGVPYARLDFDFQDARLTHLAPWRLLLNVAETLNLQMPEHPLTTVIEDAARQFATSVSVDGSPVTTAPTATEHEFGEKFMDDLRRVLSEVRRDKPILVVLDTLEVALMNPQADVLEFIRKFETLHAAAPQLRLILSGRYQLKTRLAGFENHFGSVTRRPKLGPFDQGEARDYLHRVRKLPRGRATDAIVERCNGLPIALSLFADEWQQSGGLTEKQVQEIPGPELHYLALRVLGRIPEKDVRWVLRYGVVPQEFTKAFLRDVMFDDLKAAMRGETTNDDLGRGDKTLVDYFKYESAQPEDIDALWSALERYASESSFVSRHPKFPDRLVFHEEVLRPMRRELCKQPVFAQLQARALEHALAAAEALPAGSDEWVALQCDAVFQAIQKSLPDGQEVWAKAMRQAYAAGSWTAVLTLAEELLKGEHVEKGRSGSKRRSRYPSALLREATWAKAVALFRIVIDPLTGDVGDLWSQLSLAVQTANRLRPLPRSTAIALIPPSILRARVAAWTGSPETARRIVKEAAPRTRGARARFELEVASAEAYWGDPKSLKHYDRALALAPSAGSAPASDLLRLVQQVARESANQDRYDLAHRHYCTLLDATSLEPDHRLLLTARFMHVLTRMSQSGKALDLLPSGEALLPAILERESGLSGPTLRRSRYARADFAGRSAEAFRESGDLAKAIEHASHALVIGREAQDSELQARAQIEIASNAIALRRWDPALQALLDVRRLWSDVRFQDGVVRALALNLRFLRDDIGDFRRAKQAYNESLRVGSAEWMEGWWYHFAERTRGYGSGRIRYPSQFDVVKKEKRPRRQVIATLALLSSGPSARAERILLDALERIEPASARRRLFVEQACAPIEVSAAGRKKVMELLRVGHPGERVPPSEGVSIRAQPIERALVAWVVGEPFAFRWAQSVRADALQRGAAPTLCRLVTALRDLSRQGARLPVSQPGLLSEGGEPGIVGTIAATEALLCNRAKDYRAARLWCDLAVERLQGQERPTFWLADALDTRAWLSPPSSAERLGDLERAHTLFGQLDRRIERRQVRLRLSSVQKARAAALRTMESAAVLTKPMLVPEHIRPFGRPVVVYPPSNTSIRETEKPPVLRLDWKMEAGSRVGGAIVEQVKPPATWAYSCTLPTIGKAMREIAKAPGSGKVWSRMYDYFAVRWKQATVELGDLFPKYWWKRTAAGKDWQAGLLAEERWIAPFPIEIARPKSPGIWAKPGPGPLLFRTMDSWEDNLREHILWTQRCLSMLGPKKTFGDGIEGSQTQDALREFQQRLRLEPTGTPDAATSRALFEETSARTGRPVRRVAILTPDIERAVLWSDRHNVQPERLASRYGSLGYEVSVLPAANALDSLREQRPDLIHIRAPLHESTSGGIALNLQVGRKDNLRNLTNLPSKSAAPTAVAELTTASALASALRGTDALHAPVVLLDVPLGRGGNEEMAQLFWRNSFATELFSTRCVSAVAGLGFGDLAFQELLVDRLVGPLAAGESMANAVNEARRTPDSKTRGERGRPAMRDAIAVWARMPDRVFVTSGRPASLSR